MPEELSNQTMFVLARDYYLKHLLEAGKISMSQFEQMARFLSQRFQIGDLEGDAWEAAPLDIPIRIEQMKQEPVIENTTATTIEPTEPSTGAAEPTYLPTTEYISLTDIARRYNAADPGYLIVKGEVKM